MGKNSVSPASADNDVRLYHEALPREEGFFGRQVILLPEFVPIVSRNQPCHYPETEVYNLWFYPSTGRVRCFVPLSHEFDCHGPQWEYPRMVAKCMKNIFDNGKE